MNGEGLAHKENPASAEDGERRAERLDAGRVGSGSPVGQEPGGVSAKKNKKRGQRDESEYIIETALKIIKVLEALEGRAFEPATIKRVMQRTGFPQPFCRSALITLKEAGYAKRTLDGYIVGPRLARFAGRITASNSATAES